MYPAAYFSLFPPFPRKETVFVAMSFDSRFDRRWADVIAPAISSVSVNGKRLEPMRADTRRISDSILTDILSGVSNSRIFVADITTIAVHDIPVRNPNVMYEIGIAHCVRLPEEVLLFRSDKDALLFDIANIRVNSYSPDDEPDRAKAMVSDSIIAAIREVDLRRNLAVGKALDALDIPSWMLLRDVQVSKVCHPEFNTPAQILGGAARAAAIQKLLELGAIRASITRATPETFEQLKDAQVLSYECTEFGHAVWQETARRMGLDDPELRQLLDTEERQIP